MRTGQKFAQIEEKVVVSTVLRKFRVEAAHTPEDAALMVKFECFFLWNIYFKKTFAFFF
jgi:hypothetical protein